jgi:acyl carrier protein
MDEQLLIATITENARTIFKQPTLEYSADQVFRDIRGFDSVLAIQFILAMEAAFDIELTEQEVDRMDTMGNLLTVLVAKTDARAT